MAPTTNKKIPFAATPACILCKVNEATGTMAILWTFDNLAGVLPKFPAVTAQSTGGEKVTFTRADGTEIQFDKYSLVLDGTDETEIVASADADPLATGRFEVTLTINEAPIKAGTDYVNYSAFLNELVAERDAGTKFFLIQPLALSYDELKKASPSPDSWLVGFVKIDGDLELVTGSTNTVVLKSYDVSGLEVIGNVADGVGLKVADVNGLGTDGVVSITLKRGGVGKDAILTKDLSTFSSGNFDLVKVGKPVFI